MPDLLTIQSYFENNPDVSWILLGAALLILEVTIVPGIGLFFAALGALTLGGLMTFDVIIEDSFYLQLAYFFGFTTAWTIVLWKPLKKRRAGSGYSNIIGSSATTTGNGLIKDKTGSVKWSGTTMKARIRSESEVSEIAAGEEVWIHEIKQSVLIVDVVPTTTNSD